jgi:CubicO group peptidase (beta-lactamase class C family)
MIIGSPGGLGFSPARLERLNDAFRTSVDKAEIPGAVMMIGRRGRIAFHEAYGFRDREAGAAMPRDAIFRLSSMTKPVIALAAMMLVEEGKLRLDSPVGQLLPALKDMKVGVVGGDGRLDLAMPRRAIMILDLLRHTSGIVGGHLGSSPVKQLYARAGITPGGGLTRSEFIANLAKLPLEFQPGTTFAYGFSIDVLGNILEEVCALPLDEIVRLRIAEPLGMPDTVFQVPKSARSRIAEPQIDAATGQRPAMGDPTIRPVRFSGNGNLVTSAPDWARFCQLFLGRGELDGVRMVSRKTIELMITDQLPPQAAFDPDNAASWGPALPSPAYGQGFGLGMAVRTSAARATWHGSPGDFGWVGGWGTYFWVDPREDLFALMFTQAPAQLIANIHFARSLAYGALSD